MSSPLRGAADSDAAHLHVHVGFVQRSEVKPAVKLIHIWTQNKTTEQTPHEPLGTDTQKSSEKGFYEYSYELILGAVLKENI